MSDSDSEAAVRTAAALVLASLRRVASTRLDLGQDGFARDTRGRLRNQGRDLRTARCPSMKGSGLRRFCCLLARGGAQWPDVTVVSRLS